MKVWILNHYAIDHLYSNGGRHFWIAENLKKDGYEPVVFGCNEKHNSNGTYFKSNKLARIVYSKNRVPFVAIQSTQYTGNGISRVRNMIVFALNLIKVCKLYAKKHGKPNVIYASSVHPLTVLAGEYLARYFNVPCIGEVRDLWPETLVAYGAIKRNSIVARFLYEGEKKMYQWADAMVFTMEGASDYIKEHKWDKSNGGPVDLDRVFHVCNGIDIEQFDYNARDFIISDPDLDSESVFCVVYTGAIKRANNVGLLVDTAKSLRDIDDLKILIWGEGNEVEQLQEKVKKEKLEDKVVFKGFVEKKYVASICRRADICLMHWERTSVNDYGYDYNKLFDYLASGNIVFSTIQSGHSLLEEKNCGIETVGTSPEDFANGIRGIYEMTVQERNTWGRKARKVAYDYDFKVLTQKVEEVIKVVMEGEK